MTAREDATTRGFVRVHDFGGQGPPVVMLHGAGFHGHVFTQLSSGLTARAHLWAIDLRGHGGAPAADDMGWSTMADDVADVIETLAVGPIHLVGHSLGATVALMVAARPDASIASVWAFEPVVFPDQAAGLGAAQHLAERSRNRRNHFVGQQDALDHFASRPPFDSFDATVLADYVNHGITERDGGWELSCPPGTEAGAYLGIDTFGFEWLASVDANVTVVAGSDAAGPAALSQPIVDHLADATLERWADHDHFGLFVDPDRSVRSVRAHLGFDD